MIQKRPITLAFLIFLPICAVTFYVCYWGDDSIASAIVLYPGFVIFTLLGLLFGWSFHDADSGKLFLTSSVFSFVATYVTILVIRRMKNANR